MILKRSITICKSHVRFLSKSIQNDKNILDKVGHDSNPMASCSICGSGNVGDACPFSKLE